MPFTFTSHGKCPKCGNESFTSPANPTEHAPITCLRCGHVTTVDHAIVTYETGQLDPKSLPDSE